MASPHPSRFSSEIIETLGGLIDPAFPQHDPFAGTGERLGQLADEIGFTLTGTEIEASFIVDPRISHGDATDCKSYPQSGSYHIVTSPVYPNGIADHFQARDDSHRITYRAAIKKIEGADRPLHHNNMGAYGYRGTTAHSSKRQAYWQLAIDAVHCWGGAERALVNVSDFIANGQIEPVIKGWRRLLENVGGFRTVRVYHIGTPRNRRGANSELRVATEAVIDVRRYS